MHNTAKTNESIRFVAIESNIQQSGLTETKQTCVSFLNYCLTQVKNCEYWENTIKRRQKLKNNEYGAKRQVCDRVNKELEIKRKRQLSQQNHEGQ